MKYGAQYGYAIAVMVVAIPLVIMDILRLSNRFAGPIFRLRREMAKLAAGENIGPLKFRDGDYWQDLAEELNRIAQRLQVGELRVGETSPVRGRRTGACRRETRRRTSRNRWSVSGATGVRTLAGQLEGCQLFRTGSLRFLIILPTADKAN